MTYVKAIRKMLAPLGGWYEGRDQLFEAAYQLGLRFAVHNGEVYFRTTKGTWEKTPLTIEDLAAGGEE